MQAEALTLKRPLLSGDCRVAALLAMTGGGKSLPKTKDCGGLRPSLLRSSDFRFPIFDFLPSASLRLCVRLVPISALRFPISIVKSLGVSMCANAREVAFCHYF